MGQEFYIALVLMITGFVSSGILGTFYQLIWNRPARFVVSFENWVLGFGGILFCAFAGPFIIMRNAIRGRLIEQRPLGWIFASLVIAIMWSVCSGVIMLDFAFSVINV